MPELKLLFVAADKSMRSLLVERAEMIHPGWMRYELAHTRRPGAESTVVWERVPPGSYVELQSRPTEQEIMDALNRQQEATDAR